MTVRLDQRGSIALVTLDWPERRNALDHASLDELVAVLAAATAAGTRVLVLQGAGGHFCAGADLSGVEDDGFTDALRLVLDGLRVECQAHRDRSLPDRPPVNLPRRREL